MNVTNKNTEIGSISSNKQIRILVRVATEILVRIGILVAIPKAELYLFDFTGLVLPHLDYADTIWGDQPGLTTEM